MVEANEIQKRWSWEHSGSPSVMKLRTVSFSHLCSCDCVSCKLKPVSMKLRDYVAIWSVDMGSFQAYRGSYVLALHQARHAHPTENLESRAWAPRTGAGGTGRLRGRWLMLGVTPPSRNWKEQLSWRKGYLAKYRGCCLLLWREGIGWSIWRGLRLGYNRWWEVYRCWGRDVNIFKYYWLWICWESNFLINHIVHLDLLKTNFLKCSRSRSSRWQIFGLSPL